MVRLFVIPDWRVWTAFAVHCRGKASHADKAQIYALLGLGVLFMKMEPIFVNPKVKQVRTVPTILSA